MAFISVVINGIAVATTSGHPVVIASLRQRSSLGESLQTSGRPMNIPNYASLLGIVSLIVGPIVLIVGLAS